MTRLTLITEAACCALVVALGLFELLSPSAPARASGLVLLPMGLIGFVGLRRK